MQRVDVGRGRLGNSSRKCPYIIFSISSMSESKCAKPKGTLVWTSIEGLEVKGSIVKR
jgi:hypothetical protein